MDGASGGPEDRLRVDKWLWQARFFKTRARSGEVATSGHLRVNGGRCTKASQSVRPGDVLTFPQERVIRMIRIERLGLRRGPASEAQTLYTDLEPPAVVEAGTTETGPARPAPIERTPGSGRPTKRERREIEAVRRRDP